MITGRRHTMTTSRGACRAARATESRSRLPVVVLALTELGFVSAFQAIASTLIYGKQDAVLVDAYMTIKQTDALVDWVAASGKNLTTIYITHGHGDHWFGIGALLERFP